MADKPTNERPFSKLLRAHIALLQAEAQRSIQAALTMANEDEKLPEGTRIDTRRMVWILPEEVPAVPAVDTKK